MPMPRHLVAIFGGAVSGSEAAHQLAERGVSSIVFDQNILPYGKIEDGLPKWHAKLRDKEESKIDQKLSHELVTFVPQVKLGEDISFEELTKMGFCAVLLAIGAWRDRPLPLTHADQYVDKGLIYQNPLIYWFNHKHEAHYDGPTFTITDNMAIIGGGLASLDVAKVIMFELVEKALKERGHDVDLFALDRSIARVLDGLNLTLEDLGIKGCTLYYRRRIKDMPLAPFPTDTPEQLAKAQAVQEKVLNNYRSKYLFTVEPNHMPVDIITDGDQLVGMKMKRTSIEKGRVVPVVGSEYDVRFTQVVSSIGSIPDMIPGIPAKGQTYQIEDETFCRIKGYPHVFALGNTVTGRGNIKESMSHGREISQNVIEGYLKHAEGVSDPSVSARIRGAMDAIADQIRQCTIEPNVYSSIMEKVKCFHEKVNYPGDYTEWVSAHRPERLEDFLGVNH